MRGKRIVNRGCRLGIGVCLVVCISGLTVLTAGGCSSHTKATFTLEHEGRGSLPDLPAPKLLSEEGAGDDVGG